MGTEAQKKRNKARKQAKVGRHKSAVERRKKRRADKKAAAAAGAGEQKS
jgi:hypothetical protein